MPPVNSRPFPDFQRPLFPSQMPQKSNLEVMMESMLMAQQKQDEYIKQLASKVDVLTNHNKMLEPKLPKKLLFYLHPQTDFLASPKLTLMSIVIVSL